MNLFSPYSQAHGFEILCSKSRLPSSEADASMNCNPQWRNFLESLKKNGYFRVSRTLFFFFVHTSINSR